MTSEQKALLTGTISHFREIARQNRFAENADIAHDTTRCAICHPDLLPLEPFAVYLEVVTQSVKERRPRLDDELVAAINGDLALMGLPDRITLDSLIAGNATALQCWSDWLRDALSTGLGLLSVHSSTSLEFDLDEEEAEGSGRLIQEKIQELMDYQTKNDA